MGLFSLFRKKPSPSELAEDLGPLLVQVAVHECKSFQQAWDRELDNKTQVALFAKFMILLVAVADRLAFDKFGDPVRSEILNPVVDTARTCFARQKSFGPTPEKRGLYFDRLFDRRFQMFASCSTIMGEGLDSVVFTGAQHLAETFLDDLPDSELPDAVVETGKVVTKAVVALMTVPSFKALSEK
ncbi:MAG: hypothetical protein QGF21_06155 [Vicinamibacterales bacterium]|jgi:hypothetical protein|nr:hypothetical protein [Vicinamibacterales bacterium]